MKFSCSLLVGILFFYSCGDNPKVITASKTKNVSTAKSSGIFSTSTSAKTSPAINANQPISNDLHSVVVKDILLASRYVYLKVTEGGEEFWIATSKKEITKGATYFYRSGLLKTNFESKEHNRTFDKIYLVSNLVAAKHGDSASSSHENHVQKPSNYVELRKDNHTHNQTINAVGSIKISDIVKNPQKYAGQTVQVSGKCTKINPNIMSRNWIHLKDGSQDDYDFVVTSGTFVQEGSIVTLKAKVVLDKDFGAGYKYDLILEDGVVVN